MAGALKPDIFMGSQAQEHRGLLNIKYPIEVGFATGWVISRDNATLPRRNTSGGVSTTMFMPIVEILLRHC